MTKNNLELPEEEIFTIASKVFGYVDINYFSNRLSVDGQEILQFSKEIIGKFISSVDKQKTSLLQPAYEPGDGSMDGAQLVDGEWWHPVFGCDSLDHVVDNYWNAIFKARKTPVTPISVNDRLPTFKDSGPIYGEDRTHLCWWWRTDGVEDFWETLEWDFKVRNYNNTDRPFKYTHWLPHYAIIAPKTDT